MPATSLEQIVSLAKRRGFVFPSSAVYGGLGSTWDYGPLGVELKNNVKRAWWRSVVYDRDDMEGLDAAILMNRLVWKYSGHEATFSDPMTDCRACKASRRSLDFRRNNMAPSRDQIGMLSGIETHAVKMDIEPFGSEVARSRIV